MIIRGVVEIQYNLETEDFIAFAMQWRSLPTQGASLKSNVSARWILISLPLCVVLAVVARDPIGMAVVFVASVLVILWSTVFQRRYAKNVYRQFYSPENAKGLLGPHKLILTSDWLIEQTDLQEMKCRWQHIDQVFHTPTHVFIFLNKLQAIIVPRRSLTEAQYEELKKELDQYTKGASSNVQSVSS